MKTPDQITTRELLREYPKQMYRVARGETITVTKNGKPFYDIVPRPPKRRLTIADFADLIGKGRPGETDLSQRVDEIVYGI